MSLTISSWKKKEKEKMMITTNGIFFSLKDSDCNHGNVFGSSAHKDPLRIPKSSLLSDRGMHNHFCAYPPTRNKIEAFF